MATRDWVVSLVFGGIAVALAPGPCPPFLGWTFLGIAACYSFLLRQMDSNFSWTPRLWSVEQYHHAYVRTCVEPSRDRGSSHSGWAADTILCHGGSAILQFYQTQVDIALPCRIVYFCFLLFLASGSPRFMITILCVGFSSLIGAWAYDRLERRF